MRLFFVLPLTREWIEIVNTLMLMIICLVLPLTREWIEINCPHRPQ